MSQFVHLHLHSEYSLLDGACRIEDIPKAAKAAGHSAVAITDHGVMYGAVAFYKACMAENIKPIIGCEVYVTPNSRFDKNRERGDEKDHLVLLVQNETGYKNLIKLVSRSFTEGFYRKPTVDDELLGLYHEGLIALSGCLSGYIPRRLNEGNYAEAKRYALHLSELFGRENFYLELQNHGLPEQKTALDELKKLAAETGIEPVATNDVHYLKKSDAETQAILMCVQTNSTIGEGRSPGFETDEFYYKSTEEMERLFADIPGAVANTQKIADRCSYDFDFKKQYLPAFAVPDGKKAKDYLREMTLRGLERRVKAKQIVYDEAFTAEDYKMRIEYELVVITSMGYCDYFLIVWDFVRYAREHQIPTGPGRGSGAGSLVAYLLGITDIDPVRYKLVFEAFLNPQRVSMPDFDIDFCYDRRDEVIDYVIDKYGSDHVSQIITFGTLAARAAVRDVGRALGMSYGDTDAVARLIPRQLGITLKEAMQDEKLRAMYDSSPQVRRLLDCAVALEGMPRHASTHAAGVVITDLPTSEYVPLALSSDTVVTQYDMDTIASLGLLKFDFLALRYLTIIADTEKQVKKTDPSFSVDRLPLDDADTFALIGQGRTDGMFQLESAGMRQMLSSFKPSSVEDIMIAIALYRPGPMEAIPRFLKNRQEKDKIVYSIEALRDILSETCGCIVYQEQVMQIFRVIAGYSYGKADIVRRAISKKKAGVIEKERETFIRGAEEKGIPGEAAASLFEEMTAFSNYGFKKSHAAAYALISYRTAYLKCHYPAYYLSSLLTSVLGNAPKTAQYIAECSRLRVRVLPPDINQSGMYYESDGKNIRFGLLAVKNVGTSLVQAVIEERKTLPYSSFLNFVERLPANELNRRAVESLIYAGAFDSLGISRSRLAAASKTILDAQAERNRRNLAGQLTLFADAGGAGTEDYPYPDVPELPLRRMLALEKESTGLSLSGSLLDEYTAHIERLRPVRLSEVLESFESPDEAQYREKDTVTVAGIVTNRTNKTTKNGETMAFLTLEDRYAEIEVIVFAKLYAQYAELLTPDSAVAVTGELTVRDDEAPRLMLRHAEPLIPNDRMTASPPSPGPEQAAPDVPAQNPMEADIPQQYLNNADIPAQYLNADIPAQYLNTANIPPQNPNTANIPAQYLPPEQTAVQTAKTADPKPGRLFVRVESMDCEACRRAVCLTEIFDGPTPVIFYDLSQKKYLSRPRGIDAESCVARELEALLGKNNVVWK